MNELMRQLLASARRYGFALPYVPSRVFEVSRPPDVPPQVVMQYPNSKALAVVLTQHSLDAHTPDGLRLMLEHTLSELEARAYYPALVVLTRQALPDKNPLGMFDLDTMVFADDIGYEQAFTEVKEHFESLRRNAIDRHKELLMTTDRGLRATWLAELAQFAPLLTPELQDTALAHCLDHDGNDELKGALCEFAGATRRPEKVSVAAAFLDDPVANVSRPAALAVARLKAAEDAAFHDCLLDPAVGHERVCRSGAVVQQAFEASRNARGA